jgi:hypothetical protein
MKMDFTKEEIMNQFFANKNFCKESSKRMFVIDCQSIRDRYDSELNQGSKGCSRCKRNAIVRKYQTILRANIIPAPK